MTGYGKVYEKIQAKKPQTQPFHPWSCYRDENGDIVLMYKGIHQSFYLRGITKEQVSSLREELKSFEFLDMELNQSLTTKLVCECGSSLVTDHHCDNCGRIREEEEK